MRITISETGEKTGLNPALWFFTALGAVCLWLGFANDFISLPPLALLWPAFIALMAAMAEAPKTAFLCGWLSSFAGGFAALYWLYLPVTEVGGLHFIPGLCCAALIAAFLALQGGFFSLLVRLFLPPRHAAFHLPPCDPPSRGEKSGGRVNIFQAFCVIIALGLCWHILEIINAQITGFPWLALGGALSQWIFLVQAGDIIGVWAASALWLAAVLGVVCWLYIKNINFLHAGLVIAAILALHSCLRLFPEENDSAQAEKINVLFVEGNIDQNQKWLPSFQSWTLNLYLDLTREGLEEAEREDCFKPLIIWPETALPFFFEKNSSLSEHLRKSLASFDSPLLFGAPGITDDGGEEKIYNRAFLMLPDGELAGHYDKEHLVPFGEYRPQWLNFRFLDALLQGVGIYSEGDNATPLTYENWRLGMLICYEGIFPRLARDRVAKGANLLVDISNDGWFHLTPAGRQHLYLTLGRCIENNRWLFRSTNTGISAIIDNHGRIRLAGPQFKRGVLAGDGHLLETTTIYNLIGGWLPWIFTGLIPILYFCCRSKRNREV